jgi:hypothetical protein
MQGKATRAEAVIMLGGIVVVALSFAPFFTANFGGGSLSAWDSGLSPIALYPVFAGAISAGVIALRRFANAGLAVRLGSFSWEQVHLLLGLLAVLITLGYLFGDHVGAGLGFGFWGMFGGSIALLAGAVMLSHERAGGPSGYR